MRLGPDNAARELALLTELLGAPADGTCGPSTPGTPGSPICSPYVCGGGVTICPVSPNAITTANWQSGSRVTFIFSGTPTVKHNTAGGAGTARIFLQGSADLVCAANTVLDLVYDGTQWQEVSRKTA